MVRVQLGEPALVAQLEEATGLDPVCCGFESYQGHQKENMYIFKCENENQTIEIVVGKDHDAFLPEILKAFQGFLIASGFPYVTGIEVETDGEVCYSSEDPF